MIKVTFEFATVELAIATLGKIMVGAPVAQKAAPEGNDKASPAVPAAPTARKPRADAGKPRGSYKNAGAQGSAGGNPDGESDSKPTVPAAPAPETAAPPAPAEGDKPQPSGVTPAVAAATEADAQKALEALFAAKGLAEAQRVLGLFDVTALRFLPADKRGEFITKAQEATNG